MPLHYLETYMTLVSRLCIDLTSTDSFVCYYPVTEYQTIPA